jgi:hypothetical protein
VSELAGLGIVQGGAAAVLGIVVLFILLGRLVPRRAVDDLREDYAARIAELIAERDMWRTAHGVSEEARHEDQQQVRELMEVARTADHVLRALPTRSSEEVSDAPMAAEVAP